MRSIVSNLDESKNKLIAPSILLTKLAVPKKLHGKNFGSTIIEMITEMAAKYATSMSARLLIVNAVKDKTDFYEKCDIQYCLNNKKDNKTVKMYLDLLHI